MNARADRRPAGDANDADAVRRRQLLLFSVVAAVVLVAVAAWLGMGGGKTDAPQGGIDAGIVDPDAAEMVWTRRSEARLNKVEDALRRMEQEARRLHTENEGLRAKLEAQTADALRNIDAQKAMIDELEQRLEPQAQPGAAQGNAPAGDPWFRGQAVAPQGGQPQSTAPMRTRMIETFELEGTPQSSAADTRSGPELVADAVAKPVSAWLPAGAHAEAVVLAGVDASAGVSSQGDPRPVLMRITGPAWTAAEDGAAMQVDVDGCTVTGAAHGDLSSEKVYVRFRTMTCAGPEPGTVIETDVAGFVAGSGKTGVRGPVVSREGALVEKAFLAGVVSGLGQGVSAGVPAAGGRYRHGRHGRQHRARRHRARRPRRRRVIRRAEGRRLHDPPRRAVPAGRPAPGRHEGDTGVPRRRAHRRAPEGDRSGATRSARAMT